ncbi:MAG: YkgJ family cysteine cluster protein [Deltaproteobacteria bacterium]|nr:YkgJ family cysteine cluster protein [Deltaproteobacteria bacterium]
MKKKKTAPGRGKAVGKARAARRPAAPAKAHPLPDALRGRKVLGKGDGFRFGCHSRLSCFTSCCADVNILLTPVDVLRLSRRLGIKTGEFIARHTLTPVTKDLHLPVLMLRMGDAPDKRCPFVGAAGCTVYEDRPWSCRMYPVGMGIPPARAGEDPRPVYFLFEDGFCKGRAERAEWSVERWRADQGVAAREDIESGYREVVSHPWFIGGRQFDPKRMEMFHMACYDLDKFRELVFGSSFFARFEVDDPLKAAMEKDDDALLRFGFRWLKFALFGEPTIKVRAGARVTQG